MITKKTETIYEGSRPAKMYLITILSCKENHLHVESVMRTPNEDAELKKRMF